MGGEGLVGGSGGSGFMAEYKHAAVDVILESKSTAIILLFQENFSMNTTFFWVFFSLLLRKKYRKIIYPDIFK